MRYIFDLDNTLICSRHRQLTKADGSLDLANWIQNCTREKIFADSILPLADYARDLMAKGFEVVACTARVMGKDDLDYLAANGLHFDRILSRPLGCKMKDHALKVMLLKVDARNEGIHFAEYADNTMLFDDNARVNETLIGYGFHAFNAIKLNEVA